MTESAAEPKSTALKDRLNLAAVARLADVLASASPGFRRASFVAQAVEGLDALELLPRVEHIARAIRTHLPADFEAVAAVLWRVAEGWPRYAPGQFAGDFDAWPLFPVVPMAGLEHFDLGMETLRRLTPLSTAESAIRPFIDRWGERAFETLDRWTGDPDDHVRRLVSEGTRPRLPWAPRVRRLVDDPEPGLALLERLADDPSLYVRRSVANHLNDVSKDHPERALATARTWLAQDHRHPPHVTWVVGHALRSLVKSGHPDAFTLLGCGGPAGALGVAAATVSCEPREVPWSGATVLGASVTATDGAEGVRWVVDYAVTYQGARGDAAGQKPRRKVFKGRVVEVSPGETVDLRARIDFRPISTRRYYPGPHAVEIVVNGTTVARTDFTLRAP